MRLSPYKYVAAGRPALAAPRPERGIGVESRASPRIRGRRSTCLRSTRGDAQAASSAARHCAPKQRYKRRGRERGSQWRYALGPAFFAPYRDCARRSIRAGVEAVTRVCHPRRDTARADVSSNAKLSCEPQSARANESPRGACITATKQLGHWVDSSGAFRPGPSAPAPALSASTEGYVGTPAAFALSGTRQTEGLYLDTAGLRTSMSKTVRTLRAEWAPGELGEAGRGQVQGAVDVGRTA
jgi:hypothetical protein